MKNRRSEHRRPTTSASRAPVSRRRFLGGSAMAAGGLILGPSILAACGSDSGSGTALKLARPDKPVTLPTVGDAVAAGWDTDCNGATVGGLLGLSLGEIPNAWTEPWAERIGLTLAGHDEVSLDEVVARTTQVAHSLL